MLHISRRDVEGAIRHADRALARARDAEPGSTHHVTGKVVEDLEVIGGAALNGLLSGRYGSLTYKNVPIDLAGSLALKALLLWQPRLPLAEHLHNVSTGMLAGYATKFGVGAGTALRLKAGLSPVVAGDQVDVVGADQYQIQGGPGMNRGQKNAQGLAAGEGRYGGMPTSGAERLTEAELAAMAQQMG
jgi:hypothetical protein